MIQFDEDKEKLKLAQLRRTEEEEFAKIAAQNRGLSYANLSSTPIDLDALRILTEAEAKDANLAIFSMLDRRLGAATNTPDSEKTLAALNNLKEKGFDVTVFIVSQESLNKAWERYADLSFASRTKAGSFEISNEQISRIISEAKKLSDIETLIKDILKENKSYKVTRVVETLMGGAISTGASDIHIEPEEDTVRLRYRIDGVLNDIFEFDPNTYGYILSRIKLLSGMKLNVRTEAQDGRFSIKVKDTEMEIRTSVLPGSNSESIVMRILNPDNIAVKMDELGIEPHLLSVLEREIGKPNGMILTTGPTGSGKTTTLYAFLKKVYEPGVKIITLEDPIEYHLEGIVQTQISPEKGYTFGAGLRAVLRQDPDIVMVGEIRDNETADTAVNAALTGHLVFSTLHTNSAAGAFPRLLSMGVNPRVITSAINAAMAQRLVRKLCQFCKEEVVLEGRDQEIISKTMEKMPIEDYKGLQRTKVWKAVGCEKCNNLGFKGRIGLYEAILADSEIEKVVMANPSEREIKTAARNQKLLDMKQDGIVKALQGVTSLDELRRVIDIDSEEN